MSRGHFGSGQVRSLRPGQVKPSKLLPTSSVHRQKGNSLYIIRPVPPTILGRIKKKKKNPSGWILGSRTGKEGLLDDDEGCDGADGRSVH